MAGSASGQDEANPVFWLAKQLVDYQLEVDKGKLTAVANLKSWRFER